MLRSMGESASHGEHSLALGGSYFFHRSKPDLDQMKFKHIPYNETMRQPLIVKSDNRSTPLRHDR